MKFDIFNPKTIKKFKGSILEFVKYRLEKIDSKNTNDLINFIEIILNLKIKKRVFKVHFIKTEQWQNIQRLHQKEITKNIFRVSIFDIHDNVIFSKRFNHALSVGDMGVIQFTCLKLDILNSFLVEFKEKEVQKIPILAID